MRQGERAVKGRGRRDATSSAADLTAGAGLTSRQGGVGLLQELFRIHGPAFLDRFGPTTPQVCKRVIAAIAHCHTEAAGSTLYVYLTPSQSDGRLDLHKPIPSGETHIPHDRQGRVVRTAKTSARSGRNAAVSFGSVRKPVSLTTPLIVAPAASAEFVQERGIGILLETDDRGMDLRDIIAVEAVAKLVSEQALAFPDEISEQRWLRAVEGDQRHLSSHVLSRA